MSEYPKQMTHTAFGEVTILGPADVNGTHHGIWNGRNVTLTACNLFPLPSPDDIVKVTVEMTRAQRDLVADPEMLWPVPAISAVRDACRAHRDAEA